MVTPYASPCRHYEHCTIANFCRFARALQKISSWLSRTYFFIGAENESSSLASRTVCNSLTTKHLTYVFVSMCGKF